MFELIFSTWWSTALFVLVAVILFLALFGKLILRLFGMVFIPKDQIGIVTKKFVLFGRHRTLPDGAIIALHGEAGIQADTLAPGVHFGLWPWQYYIKLEPFTTIAVNRIAIVEAQDGRPLGSGRILGRMVQCESFQNARDFLEKGGERGPQIAVIPPGTYRINKALFSVKDVEVTEVANNMVGLVTTKDGKPLETGEIAGKEVPGHNNFQDAQIFMDNGGSKGRQEQVILAGRYFINPLFASVELVPMTEVPIAQVGVVIAYVGEKGQDLTGDAFQHGNLVDKGKRGVWIEPLDPGKYPINPYTHKVELVPTANIVLNWATGKSEAHKLDERLSTITVRSSDGFTFNLDVSQIIHVPRNEAPKVIARFGTMVNLVTQVLEPTIGNYFRNAAQTSDVIEFLRKRSERQDQAKTAIREALKEYNVNAIDTLIGDITPPEALMKTLTDRKLAEQEKVTYDTQRLAEETRKELEQARAMALTQARVVDSERSVTIAGFNAEAAIKQAEGQAKSKTINAEADAQVLMTVGNAEAEKTKAVGTAEADVIKLKIESMESGNYAAVQIAQALAENKIKLVPDIVAGGSGEGGSGNTLVDVLLASVIRDNMKKDEQKQTQPQQ